MILLQQDQNQTTTTVVEEIALTREVSFIHKQALKGFRPLSAMKGIGCFQNLRNFFRNCLEIFQEDFLEEFFWRNFFGGIFWEKFFGRIFWEEFNKKLFEY